MLENIEPKRVMYFFEEMDKIPRESDNEKAVSTWIYNWARSQDLAAVQDEFYNVVIKKPATKGYENSQPVILQAHMDMVCEKTPESTHNFDTDPIKLKINGDWIESDCGTSIGADDGIGVAYCMAILEDQNLNHPPLEIILTVCEESTFDGAHGLSPKLYEGKRMINLDHAVDNQVLCGSCGGIGMDYILQIDYEKDIQKDYSFLNISVSEMEGGHSGEDIHRGRGNAIEVLVRLMDQNYVRISSISGGTYRLAIPREASAVVAVPKEMESKFCDYIANLSESIYNEYAVSASSLKIRMMPAESGPVISDASSRAIIASLRLFPNGIMEMNGAVPGVVESSINLGTVELINDNMKITAEARGSYKSTVEDIQRKVETVGELIGGKLSYYGDYAPWEYNPNSDLRTKACKVYQNLFNEKLEEIVVHAGIESAMFIEKVPEMDAIAIGCNCEYFHSPNERMSISSAQKTWKFLINLLENL